MALRNYVNGATPQPLTVGVSNVAVTLPVASTAGYPPAPFLLAIERGTANAEVVLCTGKTANTFTVTRGFDGTTGVIHLVGTVVEHCSSGIDYAEANAHVNAVHFDPTLVDQAGDLLVGTADNTLDRIAVGATDGMALLVMSSVAKKMVWTDIGQGVWTDYAPSWGAITSGTPILGNGTLVGRYRKVGKTVNYYLTLKIGSTTSLSGTTGSWVFGCPPGCVPYSSGDLSQFGSASVYKADAKIPAISVLSGTGILISYRDNGYSYTVYNGYPSNWVSGDLLRAWGTMEIV